MFRQDIPEIKNFSLVPGGPKWGDYACALSAIFFITEQETTSYFTVETVKHFTKRMYEAGYIDDEFTVVWNPCFKILGLNVSVRTKGPDYICADDEYEILDLVKPGYEHFVPGDGEGHYSWDSLGTRDSQNYYEIKSKRIIKVFRGNS